MLPLVWVLLERIHNNYLTGQYFNASKYSAIDNHKKFISIKSS